MASSGTELTIMVMAFVVFEGDDDGDVGDNIIHDYSGIVDDEP